MLLITNSRSHKPTYNVNDHINNKNDANSDGDDCKDHNSNNINDTMRDDNNNKTSTDSIDEGDDNK